MAAEEAARGWGEEGGEDGVHPALDADAILRRMLLQGMRDRRSGKRPLSGAAGGGAAVGVEGGKGAVAAERSGSGSLRRRLSAAGARVSNSGGGGGGSPGRGSPVPAAELGRRGSSSGSARPPRPASASPVASPFAAGGGAAAGSMAAGAAGSPAARVSASGGPVSEAESWLDEVHRSAESAIALLTRGSVVGRDAETAGGSGSRAVRSVLRARRSGGAGGAGVGARGPGPVAESREGGDGSSSDGSGVSSDDSDSDGGEEQGKSLDDLKDSAMGLVGLWVVGGDCVGRLGVAGRLRRRTSVPTGELELLWEGVMTTAARAMPGASWCCRALVLMRNFRLFCFDFDNKVFPYLRPPGVQDAGQEDRHHRPLLHQGHPLQGSPPLHGRDQGTAGPRGAPRGCSLHGYQHTIRYTCN